MGVCGSCVAKSFFIGWRLSIIGLFDSIRGSQMTAETVSRKVTSSGIQYMFGLQPEKCWYISYSILLFRLFIGFIKHLDWK